MLKPVTILIYLLSTVTCKHNFCDWTNCSHVICSYQNNHLYRNIIASDFDVDAEKGTVLYPMTPFIVNSILEEINIRRSHLACRRHQFLGPDDNALFIHYNMFELKWNWELAYLSRIFASKCILGRATCNSISYFDSPGVVHSYSRTLEVGEFIRESVNEWWSTGDRWYWHNPGDPEYTFNLMALAKQTHVGCAISLCKGRYYNRLFMNCHFSYNTFRHVGVHLDGLTWCLEGSDTYHGLCKNPGLI